MRLIRITAGLFAALYGLFLVATFTEPVFVERQAENYLADRLEEEVGRTFAEIKDRTTSGLAGTLARRNAAEIEALQTELEDGLDARLSAVILRMRDPDCECRRFVKRSLQDSIATRIADLRIQNSTLQEIALQAYGRIARKLQRDFRIFSGVSVVAFLFILLASFIKPRARVHLVIPSGLLLVSTLLASWLYLFEQNWFFTILTNSYVGFSYLSWIALIFGLLADIVLNRGRVTTAIINALGNALAGVFKAVPCW